jgi:hypothetical protein
MSSWPPSSRSPRCCSLPRTRTEALEVGGNPTPPRAATIEVPVGIGAQHRMSAAQVAVARAIGKPAVATLIAGGAQRPREASIMGAFSD